MSNSVHGCMQKGRHNSKCGHTWREAATVDAKQAHGHLEHPQERPGGRRLSREEKAMAHPFLHLLHGSDTLSEGAEHGGAVDKGVRIYRRA